MDVCPVEDLETHKTEIVEVIPEKETSPELPPAPLEPAVQPEHVEEDHARAKSTSPAVTETAASGPSPPAVIQVLKLFRAVMTDVI